MAFSHTLAQQISTSGNTISKDNTYSGGSQTSVDESIPDSSSDLEVAFTLDVSEIQAIYIVSDQNMTLETNSGAAPDDTISLVAGVPYVWHTGSYFVNKLTTDITALFMTNSSGSAARLQIEVVFDPTP